MGRSRRGLTSKIHLVVDTNGLPVHPALTPGEAHDNRLCSVLLSALLPQTMLLADRGYDADSRDLRELEDHLSTRYSEKPLLGEQTAKTFCKPELASIEKVPKL